MPDFNAWTLPSRINAMSAADLAVRAWMRIQDRPSTVTFRRGNTNLSAQTVRVEVSSGGADAPLGTGNATAQQGVVVYGVASHPSQANTDMRRGDRFLLNGKEYEITVIVTPPGEIQGFGEVRS